MHPLLRRGSQGSEVERLQSLLNRVGSLLKVDGDFGLLTQRAVREVQERAGLPVTGETEVATWEWLEAQPEPSPELPTEAVNFIVTEEVGGRGFYDMFCSRPSFPGESSGVTIGIGYDLRFNTADEFEADWGAVLRPDDFHELKPHVGQQGSDQVVASLAHIRIPFLAAWSVFIGRTLPRFVAVTRAAFAGFEQLPPLCRGALVSLVYNRGPAMTGDRRTEMRAIRTHIVEGRLDLVPGELVAMKRLWAGDSGLQRRRDREADFWRRGVAEQNI
ncbi:MAG: peptidoglycan-binding protein [Acidobacteriota bacterium]|jgi:peptidoglycan hydrolase-like protein with peptidoglycan-binding domain